MGIFWCTWMPVKALSLTDPSSTCQSTVGYYKYENIKHSRRHSICLPLTMRTPAPNFHHPQGHATRALVSDI
ncbi:hypothetical protein SKAU_G00014320 [Synaphobranchus kaupii]|uniref:Uncharacterized protein n=1 Tax=Synaphobranchus kaupii TaxID=118154 RepID=A0A9Q1JDT2_SYNKA|nr:hypothetical protein SKAU_G00014320 [Synaphobranchus kaupii]